MKAEAEFRRLIDVVTARSGNNKIIKGTQSSEPNIDLVQGFSASGPDVWVTSADYNQPGVVLSAVGARCGKTFLAEGTWTAIANTHVLLPSPEVDHKWLWYLTNDESFWVRGGSAQPFVKVKETLQRSIRTPHIQEQRRIVAILDETFEAIATAKANAEKNFRNARDLFESKLCALLRQEDGSDWSKKTLREVAIDFGRGKSKHRPRNDPKLYGGPYPFIQTGDVRGSEHLITEYMQTYSEAGLAQSKLWPRGTLCITIAANIAETGVLDFAACFPDSVIGVVVDEMQTSSKYLEYMLHTVKTDLKAKGKGSAQDNINLGTFENERFTFPDLQAQASIVGLLDDLSTEVQRLEGVYERKLAALDELKKSLLHRAFTGQL